MKSRLLTFNHRRPNAHRRGYTRAWESHAARFLERHPWCLGCRAIGVSRKAELVDHIVPHRGNRVLFWNPQNWQSVCAWHHNSVKPELERLFHAGRIPSAELLLSSSTARELTAARHKPAIGADGFAIAGT